MYNKITSFRNFLGLFLLVSLFSVTSNAQTVILSENFATADTGDNTGTTQNTVWEGSTNFVVDPVNSKAFEAGGTLKLGSGSAIGFVTSVPLDLSQGGGTFTVAFDVKGWTTVEGGIKITVTGLPEQTVTYTALRTDAAFDHRVITFTGGTANSTIRIETTAKRAFIDNVVVTTVPPATLAAPVATAATAVDYDSFMAHWNAVTGATDYRLDVSTASDFSSFVGAYNNFTVTGTSQEVAGLTSNTTYYFRVRAVGATTSANSNVIAVTTACGPFTLPDLTTQEFCAGSTVADLPMSSTAGFQWFATETGGNALAAADVLIPATYYLMQTVNNCESTREALVVTLNTVSAPTFTEPEIEVCNSGTIADITPSDSGYKWYTAATGGAALTSATALSNGSLFVSQTVNGCESAQRTEVTIEIVVPAVPIGAMSQNYTGGQTLNDLDVTAEDDLVWYADAALTTELAATTVLADDTTYYAVNMDETCMSAALAVTVNDNTTAAVPVATAATNITYNTFMAHWQAVAGADYYTIQISTTPDFSTVLPGWDDWQELNTSQTVSQLTGNTTYYYRVAAVVNGVPTEYSNVIEVTTACGPFIYPAVNTVEFCNPVTVGDLALSLDDYHFYASETGGQPLTADTPVTTGIIYYTNYFDNCESPRQGYSVQVNTVTTPVFEDNEVEVCNSGTIADITPEGSGYTWYAAATGGSPLASTEVLVNGPLFVSMTSGTCESERVEVLVEIEIPAVPEGATEQDFTEGETLEELTVVADEQVLWFQDEAMTVELGLNTILVDGATYYAVNNDGGCMSAPLAVTVNEVLGNSSFNMAGLVSYPNPVRDVFTVSYTNAIDTVTVYNMLGQAVVNTNSNASSIQVNMSGLASGTYFVKVVSGAESKTIKVIKQ